MFEWNCIVGILCFFLRIWLCLYSIFSFRTLPQSDQQYFSLVMWFELCILLTCIAYPFLAWNAVPHWQPHCGCLGDNDLIRSEGCDQSQFFPRILARIYKKILFGFSSIPRPCKESVNFVEWNKRKLKYKKRHIIFLLLTERLKLIKYCKLIHVYYSFLPK